MHQLEKTVDDFIAVASNAGLVLEGFIAWDQSKPDVVLFSPQFPICPNIAIPKDKIDKLEWRRTWPCTGVAGSGQMWDATIRLKAAESEEGKLLTAIISSMQKQGWQSSCETCLNHQTTSSTNQGISARVGHRAVCRQEHGTSGPWFGPCHATYAAAKQDQDSHHSGWGGFHWGGTEWCNP